MTNPAYYSAKVEDGSTVQDLIARWKEPEFQRWARAVRDAFINRKDIPSEIPLIAADFNGTSISLADLRGINLAGIDLDDVDLSYCCFANADFTGARFTRTRVQYSSFENAKLDRVHWMAVQASPIFAEQTSFRNAHIVDSFAMGSSFQNAEFKNAELENTALVGSTFEHANLDHAHRVTGVDITKAVLTDTVKLRKVLSDAIGQPHWIEPSVKINSKIAKRFFEKLEETREDLEALATKISEFKITDHRVFDLPAIGKVVRGRNRDFAAVRIAYATSLSSARKNRFKERTFQTSTKMGSVALGDIVQIDEDKFATFKNRNINSATKKTRQATAGKRMKGRSYVVTQVIEKVESPDGNASKGEIRRPAVRKALGSTDKKIVR